MNTMTISKPIVALILVTTLLSNCQAQTNGTTSTDNIHVTTRELATSSKVYGMDVSAHQGNVDWKSAYSKGARFAYVKATEGTSYKNPYFAQQYVGSYKVGMIRGSYHFARPDKSSGAAQAKFFIKNGGGWSKDGKTLPGALDIEYNPYGPKCYGLSKKAMAAWIKSFVTTYHTTTGAYPVIYTTADWFNTCVGTYGNFGSTCPLWVACYCSKPSTLPHGWKYYTIWQYNDKGKFPGDQNVFNGSMDRLKALAKQS